MTYIVAYDIVENRIRTRLAKYLEGKGVRLQKSVFALEIEKHTFKRFLGEIKKITGDDNVVIVFRLCAGCKSKSIQLSEDQKRLYIF